MNSFNILVIDDASMIRDLIKKFVRDYFPNAKIFDAHNGQAGKSVLLHQQIELVLCDWEMPEMNGLELLGWIRAEQKYKNIPFIMVTSRGDKQYVMEAIESGVSDYLVKPFNRQQFAEKVGKALKRHGIEGRMITPKKIASSSLEVLTGATSAIKKKSKQTLPKGVALVRTANGDVKCAVKQLNKDMCLGIFKFEDFMPCCLDQVSLDIEFKTEQESKVMRINGYIHSISLVDNTPERQLIEIKVILMDEDPQKHQLIAEYVSQFE